MPCYFNLCSLEINSNGGLKRNHLEFSSSATKNIISPLPRCLWLTKLGRVVTYHEGLPPIKSHEALITWSSNISWQTKFIINSTTRVVMTTKLGKMVAHLNGLLPIKSYDPMITWYCRTMWQAKTIISPLLQCPQLSNLLGWWCTWQAHKYKVIQHFDKVGSQGHLTSKNYYISVTRVPMATKLGKMLTSLDGILPIMSHDPLISWPCEIRGSLTGWGSACKRLYRHQFLVTSYKTHYHQITRQWKNSAFIKSNIISIMRIFIRISIFI